MELVVAPPRPIVQLGLRALGAMGCIGYAALAVLSGLDHEAKEDLQRPALLDWPYSVAAEYSAAQSAITRHDATQALARARTLVRHDPADSHSMSMYGLALLEAHQPDKARDAFSLAARLGWRDTVTQRYWFSEALRLGDAQQASQRLDALLRLTPDLPDGSKLLRTILAYSEGRAAIADRLKNNPIWSVEFVAQMAHLDPDDLEARAEVVQRVGPGHWECPQAANLVDALFANGLLDDSAAVHRTVCSDSGKILNDGNFNELSIGKDGSALDWHLLRRGDMVVSINAETPRSHLLAMSINAPSTVQAVWQATTVGPGSYRVNWRMPDTSAKEASALLVSFDCNGAEDWAINGTRLPGLAPNYEARFVVPKSCETPVLRLWLMPNHTITVAGMRIERLPGTGVPQHTPEAP